MQAHSATQEACLACLSDNMFSVRMKFPLTLPPGAHSLSLPTLRFFSLDYYFFFTFACYEAAVDLNVSSRTRCVHFFSFTWPHPQGQSLRETSNPKALLFTVHVLVFFFLFFLAIFVNTASNQASMAQK